MKVNKDSADMDIHEASVYWDEHDFDETDDFHEVTDIRFKLQKKNILEFLMSYIN